MVGEKLRLRRDACKMGLVGRHSLATLQVG